MTGRPSAWARWRVDLRLAWRQVRRTKGSSALVVALVALPVMALTAGVVFWASHQATPQQHVTLELGQNQAWVQIVGGANPLREQAIDDPLSFAMDGAQEEDDRGNAAPTSPQAFLPPGTRTIEVHQGGTAYVETAAGTAHVATTTGPVWDPVFAGRYTVLEGTAPASTSEAMVTPGLLARLGMDIGGTVTFPDEHTTLTITGTMRELDEPPGVNQLFLTEPGDLVTDSGAARWYTPDWQPDVQTLPALNHAGLVAFARDLVLDPPAGSRLASDDAGAMWTAAAYTGVGAAFEGYLVVLLAGAAFAVSARRQARSLAVAVSVGARRADVFRVVLLQGAVLGLIGGAVGALLGLGLTAAARTLLDDHVVGSLTSGWGWNVPWPMVIAIVVFAVAVGLLSAAAPARSATRGDVLAALRGSRRPARLRPHRPAWGVGLMVLGMAATIAGALLMAALNAAKPIDYQSPWRAVALGAIIAGPLVFQVGMIVGGHWTLSVLSRVLSRMGVGARLASRDAAANPSRVVPAFAAIAACVFVASFALSMTAMLSAGTTRTYRWAGHPGTVTVWMWGDHMSDTKTFLDPARSVLAASTPRTTALVSTPAEPTLDPNTLEAQDPTARAWSVAKAHSEDPSCAHCRDDYRYLFGATLRVIAPDDLTTLLGVSLGVADLDAFRNGSALAVDRYGFGDDTATIAEWTAAGQSEYVTTEGGSSGPAALHTVPMRSVAVPYPQEEDVVYIATATAGKLGMSLEPERIVATYAAPPADSVIDAMTADAANIRIGREGRIGVYAEKGPAAVSPVLWLISAATAVLVIGAGSICLGLSRFERRPDDATLTAVGARPTTRRVVSAWQAAIVVGLGTAVGVTASLLPTWGVAQTTADYLRFTEVPWLWLAITAFGLPLVMAAASWLIPPRAPDLIRRTAIA
ncbi:FtsX-like permease family protein [Microbacterium horticulturae]|uniref:FtsX-like permease family protein n=1 Tax=Microbacterium horticulturae TaxID=3028316 RepID=A0ABY8BZ36_9MICO|nr:FtsX-like permease family protein [Microbacterium sp. KACC 23027]WEG07858.1 FtsX-like permease family protein [Microbacterium sp. KACC 23027]